MNIFDRLESNVRSYCRSIPAVFSSAQGSVLTNEQGQSYIDFLSGGGALNYGHNNPAMKKAVIDYLADDGLIQGLDLHTCAKSLFLDAFETLILQPRNLEYKLQFAGPTGSNAVEAALKLARLVKKRSNIIAFTNSYHGLTLGALAVTGNAFFRNESFVDRHNVSFIPFDGYYGQTINSAEYFRKAIADPGSGVDLPAAILVETVQAEGGVNVAGREWLQSLAALCRENDILLIVDEIQTGIGRTGPFFSFEDAGLYPDIVILSKSLSGFGLPMSLVLLKPELDQWQPGEHSGTFRGNNLAFITAAESLQQFWQNDDLSSKIEAMGQMIGAKLKAITTRFPDIIPAARGKGMLHGIQTTGAAHAQEVITTCFRQGLLVEACGPRKDVVKIIPPLTIDDDLLNRGLNILEESIAKDCKQTKG